MSNALHSFPPPLTTSDGTSQDPPIVLHRLSVEQYHAMIENEILTRADRVELLDGWICEMTPPGPPHSLVSNVLQSWFHTIKPSNWFVQIAQPITLATSEPEPDVSIVRGTPMQFRDRHPGSSEVLLVVEISQSSAARDRKLKARLYAEAGIPEYWIVDLNARSATVYRNPQPAAADKPGFYQQATDLPADGSLSLTLDGKLLGEFSLASIWPKG